MHNYEHIKFIGSGSFGKVDLVRNIKEDREYVIKKIQTRDLTDKDRENIKNEVGTTQSRLGSFRSSGIRILWLTRIASSTRTASI